MRSIFATLSQNSMHRAFMSQTLQGSELHYPAAKKEATAIIEAIRKWISYSKNSFTLVIAQRFMAFMLDSRRRSKIRKVQQWWMELALYLHNINYKKAEYCN